MSIKTIPVVIRECETLQKFHKWLPHAHKIGHALVTVIGRKDMRVYLLAGDVIVLKHIMDN